MKYSYKPIIPLLFFGIVMVVCACAQTEAAPTPDSFRTNAEFYYVGMTTDVKIIEIGASVLAELEKEDMRRYAKLETVIISFGEDPAAPFSEKKLVIDMVTKNLDHLAALKNCPALKNIALQVGEMLFIRETEKLGREEADRRNLSRAVNEYAAKIAGILPGIKLYAHNWGW